MRQREVLLEFCPRLVHVRFSFPQFVIVCKHSDFIDELVRDVDHLFSCVLSGFGRCELYGVLYLLNQNFYGLICIVRGFHDFVIVTQVGGRDACICGIHLIQNVLRCVVLIAHIFVLEGADVELIYGSEKDLLEGFICVAVLVEEIQLYLVGVT